MGEIVLGGRYVIENEIGSGGMAIVYKAHDKMLNRTVAVKVLRPEFKQDEEFIKRFDTEAKSAAGLNHPNIVAIHDVGIHEGLRYIVMECVKGETLKDVIRKNGRLPWDKALDFARKICSALSHAHERKIIHRDIKPHNIMVTEDGNLKVMDFGIARATSASTMTMGAKVLGSAHYLSPEQARGGFTDERSDLYSLGVCLYEMVTGKVPFDAETTVAVAMQHLQKDVPSPKDAVPELPDSVEHIILKAMKKEQAQRYLSAALMESDIIRAMADPGVIPDGGENDSFYSTRHMDIIEEPIKESDKKRKKEKSLVTMLSVTGIIVAVILAILIVFSLISGAGRRESKLVPQLQGLTAEEAEEIVSEIDEEIVIVVKEEYSSKENKGKIIDQDPAADKKFPQSGRIYVTVGKGEEYMELNSFIGDKVENAEEELADMGLRFKVEFEEDDDLNEEYAEGTVTRQEPPAGTKLRVESEVTLYASKGNGSVNPKIPEVIGLDIEEAKRTLKEKGYFFIAETEEESEEKPGTVIAQKPEKDKRTSVDEVITLVIAKEKKDAGRTQGGNSTKSHELKFTVPGGERDVVVKVIKGDNGETVYRKNHKPLEEVTINVMLKENETGRYEIYINDVFHEEKRVQG